MEIYSVKEKEIAEDFMYTHFEEVEENKDAYSQEVIGASMELYVMQKIVSTLLEKSREFLKLKGIEDPGDLLSIGKAIEEGIKREYQVHTLEGRLLFKYHVWRTKEVGKLKKVYPDKSEEELGYIVDDNVWWGMYYYNYFHNVGDIESYTWDIADVDVYRYMINHHTRLEEESEEKLKSIELARMVNAATLLMTTSEKFLTEKSVDVEDYSMIIDTALELGITKEFSLDIEEEKDVISYMVWRAIEQERIELLNSNLEAHEINTFDDIDSDVIGGMYYLWYFNEIGDIENYIW